MTADDNSSETTVALSPGQMLTQARERAGLTQQEVAQALHMSASKVRAIEADDYAKLNVNTFVRGYLRSYAILVNVNSAELLSAYEQQAVAQGLLPSLIQDVGKVSSGRKTWGFIGWLALFFAILLLISVWFFGNQITPPMASSPPLESAKALSHAPVQANTEAALTNDSGEEVQAPVTNSVDASAGSDAATVAVNQGQEQEQEQEQEVSISINPQPELDVLQLGFSDECWLEVSDARGDALATELQRPGSRLSLQGVAPFQVKLGNAPAAQISLNGEPVPISPPVGDKVFTMSVGQ
jgi:cytoskeleton protein RodZ